MLICGDVREPPSNAFLFLYMRTYKNDDFPNGEGLLALKHFFDLRTVKEPSSETLLCLAELELTGTKLFFMIRWQLL